MYRFLGTSIGISGLGTDVPYTDSKNKSAIANVQPKSPDCGSIKAVQQMLSDMGYAPGAVDGMFGKNTYGAMTRFAADHGISYTSGNYPTANFCSSLLAAWQQHQIAAQSTSPAGADIVATTATPAPTPGVVYTASPDGSTIPADQASAIDAQKASGPIEQVKSWWSAASSQTKALVVGGVGLAVVAVAALSLQAPVGKPMTANRRRRRYARNGCGCKAPVSVGTMAANGRAGLVAARKRMDTMSSAELKRFADRLHRAGYKGDAYRLWMKAIDILQDRGAIGPGSNQLRQNGRVKIPMAEIRKMHRISWTYPTGRKGETYVSTTHVQESVTHLQRMGAKNIRVSLSHPESSGMSHFRNNKRRAKKRRMAGR